MAQLMPLPLTVSCFSEIQIDFTFLAPAHPGSSGKRAVKWVCACVCVGAGSARRLTGSEQGAVVTERQTVDELSVTVQVFEQHA